jgi:hypothetical protein
VHLLADAQCRLECGAAAKTTAHLDLFCDKDLITIERRSSAAVTTRRGSPSPAAGGQRRAEMSASIGQLRL